MLSFINSWRFFDSIYALYDPLYLFSSLLTCLHYKLTESRQHEKLEQPIEFLSCHDKKSMRMKLTFHPHSSAYGLVVTKSLRSHLYWKDMTIRVSEYDQQSAFHELVRPTSPRLLHLIWVNIRNKLDLTLLIVFKTTFCRSINAFFEGIRHIQ
jgi:hypothetical protein